MSLYEYLINIYKEFGFQRETTVNVVRPGKTGAEEIQQMMINYRANAPKEIAGEKVVKIKDFQLSEQKELINGEWKTTPIEMALGARDSPIQMMIGPVTTGGKKCMTFFTPTALMRSAMIT